MASIACLSRLQRGVAQQQVGRLLAVLRGQAGRCPSSGQQRRQTDGAAQLRCLGSAQHRGRGRRQLLYGKKVLLQQEAVA